jgi:hypothetical protein
MRPQYLRHKALEYVIHALRIEAVAAATHTQHVRRCREVARQCWTLSDDDTPGSLMFEAVQAEFKAVQRLHAAQRLAEEMTRAY